MLPLLLGAPAKTPLRVLAIGAHSDDIEIGAGGTLLTLLAARRRLELYWLVLSAQGRRADEARRSAMALTRGARALHLDLAAFRDGYFPAEFAQIKDHFEATKRRVKPELILTHRLEDRHQDHRITAELTWNTWRDHLIAEYEIPKYEGDLATPNVYVPLTAALARRKATHLARHFDTQRGKRWFRAENFLALARLRGLECRAPSGYAEGLMVRKCVLQAN
jgi:LmbE family N-acetylglucosaminyl deacetylase